MELEECLKEIYAHNQIINVKTSGSTGTPKVMQADKELMINSSRMMCDYLKLVAADTALLCLPLDYIAGKMMVIRCIERQLRLVCVEPSGHRCAADRRQRFVIMSSENARRWSPRGAFPV